MNALITPATATRASKAKATAPRKANRVASPIVKYTESSDLLVIQGHSSAPNTHVLYESLRVLITEHFMHRQSLQVGLYLKDLNASSIKGLFNLFSTCQKMKAKGNSLRIHWFCTEDHPEMIETGLDFAELYELNLKMVTI